MEEEIKKEDFVLDGKHGNHNQKAVTRNFTFYVRGNGVVSSSKQREKEIQAAEEFLHTLNDLIYNVSKVMPLGRIKERKLRITQRGIENIRIKPSKEEVSSFYPFESVLGIFMRDTETLVIQYEFAKHDYVYKSPVAMQIVQEITSRLLLKRGLEKKKSLYGVAVKQKTELDKYKTPRDQLKPQSSSTINEHLQSIVIPGYQRSGSIDMKRGTKINMLTGSTELQRVETEIDKILLDANTLEGKMINSFIKNYNSVTKSPATLCSNTRRFIDSIREELMKKRHDELNRIANDDSFPSEEINFNGLVERCVEKAVILPIYDRIMSSLSSQKDIKAADELIKQRILILRNKSPDFFGVSEEHGSISFAGAVLELSYLKQKAVPADKLAAILSASRAIYNAVQHDSMKKGAQTPHFLSADDFLPIFFYVVVNSEPSDGLESISEYVWGLCDPDQLQGESGYYLTTFVSCLSYFKSLNEDQLGTRTDGKSNLAKFRGTV